jgi:acyl-CoA synthetase (AMP-forming)/AMP-acid ligase II
MAESSFSLSPTLPLSTSDYTPLLQRVSEHARKTPDKVAATFLVPATSSGGGGGVVTTTKVQRQLTYRDLERVTSALAERLVSKEGLRAGDW